MLSALVLFGSATTTTKANGLPYKIDRSSLGAQEKTQEKNLKWALHVCYRGRGKPKRFACKARVWIKRELKETKVLIQPPHPLIDSCTMEIIRREASGFDPSKPSTWRAAATRYNGHGSGAYGVPQALPGSKMASAGSDWATNPWTQIKWMMGYMQGRYGGSCSALSFWNSNGYY
jgi:hypothetical protein